MSGRDKGQLISGWTRQHARSAALMVVTAAAGALAVVEESPFSLLALTAAVATIAVALFVDGFGGIVVGLVGAAMVIGFKQLGGLWTPETFLVSSGSAALLVSGAWLAGMVSSDLHSRTGGAVHDALGASPFSGSLGLLGYDLALARLDEEIARASTHHRPLVVAVVDIRLTDARLDDAARIAAGRSVARLVETLVRETDVPFAIGPHLLGVIMPESDPATAWEVLGRVLNAAEEAEFTVRESDQRLKLTDCAELHVGIVAANMRFSTAARLVEAARPSSSMEVETP